MSLPAHYTPTPCSACGAPVVIVTVAGGDRVVLDTAAPLFVRQADGEGGAVWAQDASGELLARHKAVCGARRPSA